MKTQDCNRHYILWDQEFAEIGLVFNSPNFDSVKYLEKSI